MLWQHIAPSSSTYSFKTSSCQLSIELLIVNPYVLCKLLHLNLPNISNIIFQNHSILKSECLFSNSNPKPRIPKF